ncbi:2-methyl branched-chain enoyl CoA reductase isoform I, partial [Aphelenchoides avenae]
LTQEQRQLQTAVKEFVKKEVVPVAAEYDRSKKFPLEVIKKAHENGFMNVGFPEEYGGLNLDLVSNAVLTETLGYGCSAIAGSIYINELASRPLILYGSEDVKKKYVTRLTSAPLMAGFCCTEPDSGSDMTSMKSKAELKGKSFFQCATLAHSAGDEWILNGTKNWVMNGGVANFLFVLARTNPDPKAPFTKAFSGFVVDADAAGVTIHQRTETLGMRACDIRTISFKDVRIPASHIIGKPGDGWKVAMRTFDRTRPLAASIAVGVMARALDESARYAMERKTFGVAIAQHQAVAFMLAEMSKKLELSRLMVYRSAQATGNDDKNGTFLASLAKAYAGDSAMEVATNAIQVFGGVGFNTEYPVEKLFRDAKASSIYDGATQIHNIGIASNLFKRLKDTGSAGLW